MCINFTFHVKSMINDAMACKIKRPPQRGTAQGRNSRPRRLFPPNGLCLFKRPTAWSWPEMLQRPKPFKLDAGNQAKIEALFKASPSNCAVVTQRINADPVGYGLPADTTVSRRSVERYGKARFPGLFAKSAMLPVQPFHCEKGE